MAQQYALVAVENVSYHFDKLYSYLIPEKFVQSCLKGARVQIPFGRGTAQRQGFAFDITDEPPAGRAKPIAGVLESEILLSDEMIELAKFLKDRYFCTLFEAAKAQLPAGFDFKLKVSYIIASDADGSGLKGDDEAVFSFLKQNEAYFTPKEIAEAAGISESTKAFETLLRKGLIERNYESKGKIGNINVKRAALKLSTDELSTSVFNITPKQQAVIDVLEQAGSCSVKELCYFAGVTGSVVNALEKKGIIELNDEPVFRLPKLNFSSPKQSRELILNHEQQKAFDTLVEKFNSGGGTALLYGVTGSGKTSVFLKLIDFVVARGRQVIVMVPEIALTPQMMAIFTSRYGENVAIFHSALSIGERKDEYRRIKEGKAQIALGTRSAVFAPVSKLGLVVIDEEQEHTYKSEASPRYHAREVARFRTARAGALLLLASATPSLESYSRARAGQYILCRLNERFGNATLPDVTVADMKAQMKAGNYTSFSTQLMELLTETLQNGNQAVLLMNRRGFNTFAACNSCGKVIMCPNCSVSLTYHSANGRLMCHYCGHSEPMRQKCPHCHQKSVRYAGTGTQKIEQELEAMLPEAKIMRLDADSVANRTSFERSLSEFGNGKYNVLLGTQMVAKGLDFQNVTLVGVINADTQLYDDDYRSGETTFDLLTQVVGRSGRGTQKGKAVIQTLNPENNVIQLAKQQDYEGFFESEMSIRKSMVYPPFCDLCVVTAISLNHNEAYMAVREYLRLMRELCDGEYGDLKIMALPPTTPRIERIANRSRHRMIIKCKNSRRFREMTARLITAVSSAPAYKNVTLIVDINPQSSN